MRRGGWTQAEHMQALTVELLDELRRVNLLVGGAKRHQLPTPLRIDRPRTDRAESPGPARRAATADEAAALFAAALPT